MGKRLSVLVGITIAMLFVAHNAFAEQKVAFVDLASVFNDYEKTKEFDVKLEGTQKAKQEEIDSKVEVIKGLQEKLSLLSDKEKEKKQEEIDAKTRELQEFQRESEKTLITDRDERLKEILQDIQTIVENIAKKEGYDLILNERVLLFGNDSMDISQTVLKQLNENYKKK